MTGVTFFDRETRVVIEFSESYVIVNRLENANKLMDSVGVKLYQLTDILEITKILFEERLIDEEILEKIKKQIDQAS